MGCGVAGCARPWTAGEEVAVRGPTRKRQSAYTVTLHYSLNAAMSMERPTAYFRLLPPRGDTFELKYFLKTSSYRVGYEFSSGPKAESLPIHDVVYLGD